MPRPSKGLTCAFSLKMTEGERAIIECVQKAHADLDIKISLNDAIRILIVRARMPFPAGEPSARRAVKTHLQDCDYCTRDVIACPDGWRLHDAYMRITEQKEPAT